MTHLLRIAVAALVLIIGVAMGEDGGPLSPPTFRQVIQQANDDSSALHLQMEAHFDRLRDNVSQHMSSIGQNTLERLLDAIRTVERCRSSSNGATVEYEQLGAQISRCAQLGDLATQQQADAFYEALAGAQDVSLGLLSLVLDYVGRSNAVDRPGEMGAEIGRTISGIRATFEEETLPALEEQVTTLATAVEAIPGRIAQCVEPVLEAVVEC